MNRSRPFAAADLAKVAVFAGLICALSVTASLHLFGSSVPVTLQTLGVMLAGLVLGPRLGPLAVLVYLAIGAAGVPVFAGHTGGLGVFAGPTAGYLVAFPLGALVIGLIAFQHGRFRPALAFPAAIAGGIVVVHSIGVVVLAWRAGLDPGQAAVAGSVIFLPGDLLKAVIATLVAIGVHRAYPALGAGTEPREPATA